MSFGNVVAIRCCLFCKTVRGAVFAEKIWDIEVSVQVFSNTYSIINTKMKNINKGMGFNV